MMIALYILLPLLVCIYYERQKRLSFESKKNEHYYINEKESIFHVNNFNAYNVNSIIKNQDELQEKPFGLNIKKKTNNKKELHFNLQLLDYLLAVEFTFNDMIGRERRSFDALKEYNELKVEIQEKVIDLTNKKTSQIV